MTCKVTVTTGARLHFGPLSYRPTEGRHFGGVGLMLADPGCQLTVQSSPNDLVTGDPATSKRVRSFVERIRRHTPPDLQPPPSRIEVVRSIPSHSGLGSGTQLGLAVASGLAKFVGEDDASIATLAARVERGRRSAIGLHGFKAGGLIVDAGKRPEEDIGALSCRLPFPEKWRVLLMTPERQLPGLSGASEEQAFERLGSMATALSDRLCRLVLTELLPAVHAADLDAFCKAVSEYGTLVGRFFAPVQGGIFGNDRTDELVNRLNQMGIRGVGQTSWGPTLFAFADSPEHARDLVDRLENRQTAEARLSKIEVAAPLNTGATVMVSG